MARAGDGGFTMIGQSQSFGLARRQRLRSSHLFPGSAHCRSAAGGDHRPGCPGIARSTSSGLHRREGIVVGRHRSDRHGSDSAQRRSRIRLVRSEFEELIRDAIDDTVDATRRAIRSAGMIERDIDAVVLAGGSSRIPLVAQVMSAEFGLPIVVDSSPEASTSLGAAVSPRRPSGSGRAISAELDAADHTADPTDQSRPSNHRPSKYRPGPYRPTIAGAPIPPDQIPPKRLPTEESHNCRREPRPAAPDPAAAPAGSVPAPPVRSAKGPAGPIGRRDQS